jgi:hypothetical protein
VWSRDNSTEAIARKGNAMPRITRIHVNQHIIRRNAKTGEHGPVLTVKAGGGNTYAHAVQILGPSTVVYSPCKPLSCGARVWIETKAEVVIDPEEA